MRMIPSSCGDFVVPDDCVDDAFQIAKCLVEVGMDALTPFAPEITGECPPFVGFVTFASGRHPDDLCDQLTVSIEEISPRVIGKQGIAKCIVRWIVKFRFEVTFGNYPMIEQRGDEIFIPSPEYQEASARWMYAYGVALTAALMGELASPTCTALQGRAGAMAPLKPSGPLGGCAGWWTSITVEI